MRDAVLDFEIWDVFTDRAFSGNPLAVVLGADGLETAQMQTIAQQFNLSETIFLMAPRDPGHTARARIFFPEQEVPFAGHPTIGAAVCLAARHGLTAMVLEEEAGLVSVDVQGAQATLAVPTLPERVAASLDVAACAAALGLSADQVGPHAPGVFSGGPSYLYLPVRDRSALAAAAPVQPAWSKVMEPLGLRSVWLYDPDLNARKFTAIAEDPATGAAAAILMGQLLAEGVLAAGTTRLTIRQGEDMGRPSRIEVEADVSGGRLSEVRLSGQAVPVADGRIRIPG